MLTVDSIVINVPMERSRYGEWTTKLHAVLLLKPKTAVESSRYPNLSICLYCMNTVYIHDLNDTDTCAYLLDDAHGKGLLCTVSDPRIIAIHMIETQILYAPLNGLLTTNSEYNCNTYYILCILFLCSSFCHRVVIRTRRCTLRTAPTLLPVVHFQV